MNFLFEDIKVRKKIILEGGSFDIDKNGVYIFHGLNGAGKTMLFNYLFEQKVNEDIKCAFIEQSSDRIIDNESISYNIFLDNSNIPIENAEINKLLRHKYNELSGGEKHLICLLRGLLSDAEVIFIDEPTNELDYEAVALVKQIIKKIKADKKLLIITHDDRMNDLGDGIFYIDDRKLFYEDEPINTLQNVVFTSENNQKIFHKNIFKHFSRGFISILCSVIFLLSLTYSGIKLFNSKSEKIEKIEENVVEIYAPVAENYLNEKTSMLPIRFAGLFSDDNEMMDIVGYISDDTNERNDINFTLELDSDSNYQVCILEYYDMEHHESIPIEANTKNLDYEKAEKLNEELKPVYKENEDLGYRGVYLKIYLKENYTFREFVKDKNVQKLFDGNYYIRTNETIDVINNLDIFEAQKGNLILMLIITFTLILVEIIFYFLYFAIKTKDIRIYRNMGINRLSIKYSINKKLGLKTILFLSSLLFSISNIICIVFIGKEYILIFIITIVYLVLRCILTTLTVNNRIDRISGWRYRC